MDVLARGRIGAERFVLQGFGMEGLFAYFGTDIYVEIVRYMCGKRDVEALFSVCHSIYDCAEEIKERLNWVKTADFCGFYNGKKLTEEQANCLRRLYNGRTSTRELFLYKIRDLENWATSQNIQDRKLALTILKERIIRGKNFICAVSPLCEPIVLQLIYAGAILAAGKRVVILTDKDINLYRKRMNMLIHHNVSVMKFTAARFVPNYHYVFETECDVIIIDCEHFSSRAFSEIPLQSKSQYVIFTLFSEDEKYISDNEILFLSDCMGKKKVLCFTKIEVMPDDADTHDVHYYPCILPIGNEEYPTVKSTSGNTCDAVLKTIKKVVTRNKEEYLIIEPDLSSACSNEETIYFRMLLQEQMFKYENILFMNRKTALKCARSGLKIKNLIIPFVADYDFTQKTLNITRRIVLLYNRLQANRHHINVWLISANGPFVLNLLVPNLLTREYNTYMGITKPQYMCNVSYPFSHYAIPQLYLFYQGIGITDRALSWLQKSLGFAHCDGSIDEYKRSCYTEKAEVPKYVTQLKPYIHIQALCYARVLSERKVEYFLDLPRIDINRLFSKSSNCYPMNELIQLLHDYNLSKVGSIPELQERLLEHCTSHQKRTLRNKRSATHKPTTTRALRPTMLQ